MVSESDLQVLNVSIANVQNELPDRLLTLLERRWYEDFDSSDFTYTFDGGDTQAETSIVEIKEVVHGPDIVRSLHLHNMQNVIAGVRDGSHSMIYAVRSDSRSGLCHIKKKTGLFPRQT